MATGEKGEGSSGHLSGFGTAHCSFCPYRWGAPPSAFPKHLWFPNSQKGSSLTTRPKKPPPSPAPHAPVAVPEPVCPASATQTPWLEALDSTGTNVGLYVFLLSPGPIASSHKSAYNFREEQGRVRRWVHPTFHYALNFYKHGLLLIM